MTKQIEMKNILENFLETYKLQKKYLDDNDKYKTDGKKFIDWYINESGNVKNNDLLHSVSESDIIHECNKCMFDKKLGFCPKCDTDCLSH